MPKEALFLMIILLGSLFLNNSYSFLGGDTPQKFQQTSQLEYGSGIIKIDTILQEKQNPLKRYLIFGNGNPFDIQLEMHNQIYSINSPNGFFSVGIISENKISYFQSQGYRVIEDFPLDFHSTNSNDLPEISGIGQSLVRLVSRSCLL